MLSFMGNSLYILKNIKYHYMDKKEIFKYIDAGATTYDTKSWLVNNAKYCIEHLKIGRSKLFIWEGDRLVTNSSVRYMVEPSKFGLHEINKITKIGRGMYNMEIIPDDQIKVGELYK